MARAPKAAMESSEKMSNSGEEAEVGALDSPKDQLVWAQYLHDAQYFDLSSFSPRGLISPRGEMGGFSDLGLVCASPLFSDQMKFIQNWSAPRVSNSEPTAEANVPGPVAAVADGDHAKPMQSFDLTRASHSECLSSSMSGDSEPSSSNELGKMGTSKSTGSGEDAGKGRKRKSVDRDKEANEGSEGEDLEVGNHAPVSANQQKLKGPKRLREPRYSVKTRTEVDIMDDGYKWRKYGQKPVKNSPHPRNYYRCTTSNCPVRKRVERSTEDSGLVVTSYEGIHTHPKVTQQKRTPSGHYAAYEPAESLSDALNQLNHRQQQAATNSTTPPLPPSNLGPLPNMSQLFSGWPSLMNRQATAMPPMAPSFNDNVGLMMAYQIVRLQWELQSKVQQFMSYNAQQGFGGTLPKMNPFMNPSMNPFLDSMGSSVPDFNALLQNYGEGSEAEEFERPKMPKEPETLPGSLLSRRAAMRAGSPLNPNVQNVMNMQQLMSQAMAGFQQAALDQQESFSEIALATSDPKPENSALERRVLIFEYENYMAQRGASFYLRKQLVAIHYTAPGISARLLIAALYIFIYLLMALV